jgi:FkbM family methyltransferase
MDSERKIGHDLCLRGLQKRGYRPRVIVDIGAAQGDWTLDAMQSFPDASYFLIEALEERRVQLAELHRRNPNVDFEICGVADKPGELTFGVTPDLYASSFAYPGNNNRTLRVRTVDELFAAGRFSQPAFMKLDVQGFELKVLDGAKSVLPRTDLVLLELEFYRFSESMPLLHESIEYMLQWNFRPYEIVDVLRRPFDGAMGQCDILFCRQDHWLTSSNRWS